MNKPISSLTAKIVAFSEIEEVDANEAVDWAIEMMELGYESPALFMLASFEKPITHYEIKDYTIIAVSEIGLKMKTGDDAIISYASYFIQNIANGKDIRENLKALYQFCQRQDYEGITYDFYLLYWAWDDLDYNDTDHNHYWESAKRNNIEQIVIQKAREWVTKNKEHYSV